MPPAAITGAVTVPALQFVQSIIEPAQAEPEELHNWRERILSSILLLAMSLGSLAAVPSVWYAMSLGLSAIAWIDLTALVWVATLWRLRTLSYRFRAWNLLALIYLLGVWFLFTVGPASEIYLMAFPVMVALMLGLRPALLALVLNAFTLLCIGYLSGADIHIPGFDAHPFMEWVVITVNFIFINAVITITCGVLLGRLESSLTQQRAITESLKEGQAHLKLANEELRLTGAAVQRLNDIVVITEADPLDPPGPRIVFVNDAFAQHTGYTREEVIGQSPRILQGPETNRTELDRIKTALQRQEPVSAELLNYAKDGKTFWLELDIVPVIDNDGRLTHWVSVERNITERKKAEADIHRLAYFDALTGLPNRRMLQDRLAHVLSTARRAPLAGALLYLDLDRFKNINDARGHAAGDELLVKVAQRLSALIRAEDTVARLGGDEFVVLTTHLSEEDDGGARAAMLIANKVRETLEQSFTIDGQPYSVSVSIGVTLLSGNGQTGHDVLREADTAMYRAKAAGRSHIAFFEAAMQVEVEEHLALENDLAQAIDLNQLALHLQRQVDPAGRTIGCEALLRWTHPVHGAVAPARFIPVAEESTLILRLGDWVMEQAMCMQVRLQAAGRVLPVSINVSPRQFHQPDFVERVTALLTRTGANPACLVLEVTEGLLIENFESTISRMNRIVALGIRFSIDDFGTGYSSLSYLKRLPLYELKIDRSFILDTPLDPSDTAIVQLILSMARHLGLRVVAEGVETREQAAFLTANGCNAMQGFLFARPEPLDDWLARPEI
jgi:diguanylate cyclase (GGDEF)-like protein/PAS domain S-box-containing protein